MVFIVIDMYILAISTYCSYSNCIILTLDSSHSETKPLRTFSDVNITRYSSCNNITIEIKLSTINTILFTALDFIVHAQACKPYVIRLQHIVMSNCNAL